jgi:hypothetical protein
MPAARLGSACSRHGGTLSHLVNVWRGQELVAYPCVELALGESCLVGFDQSSSFLGQQLGPLKSGMVCTLCAAAVWQMHVVLIGMYTHTMEAAMCVCSTRTRLVLLTTWG